MKLLLDFRLTNIPYLVTKEITPEDYIRCIKYGILPSSSEEIEFLRDGQISYSNKLELIGWKQ